MKKTLLLSGLFLFLTTTIFSQEKINWISMDDALEAQKENPKKILMDAYTDWCYPCKLMDKNTFGNQDVAKFINENFYAVKFDAEGEEEVNYNGQTFTNPNYDPARAGRRNHQHDFARILKITAYPTIAFFDEEGEFIAPIPGYHQPKEIELFLNMMLKDDYKNLTTSEEFEEYQKNFKPTFKD